MLTVLKLKQDQHKHNLGLLNPGQFRAQQAAKMIFAGPCLRPLRLYMMNGFSVDWKPNLTNFTDFLRPQLEQGVYWYIESIFTPWVESPRWRLARSARGFILNPLQSGQNVFGNWHMLKGHEAYILSVMSRKIQIWLPVDSPYIPSIHSPLCSAWASERERHAWKRFMTSIRPA